MHCSRTDNFILFYFCKEIFKIIYTLNFPDIPLKFLTVAMLVIGALYTIFKVFCVGMFMKYLHTMFHMF